MLGVFNKILESDLLMAICVSQRHIIRGYHMKIQLHSFLATFITLFLITLFGSKENASAAQTTRMEAILVCEMPEKTDSTVKYVWTIERRKYSIMMLKYESEKQYQASLIDLGSVKEISVKTEAADPTTSTKEKTTYVAVLENPSNETTKLEATFEDIRRTGIGELSAPALPNKILTMSSCKRFPENW